MTSVCIIGAGDLGGAVAHALARGARTARVVLVDDNAAAASGKALDIQQAGAIGGFHARLDGTADFTRTAGCSVSVIADRFGAAAAEWRGEGGLAMLMRLVPYIADAPIVFAGASHGSLLLDVGREAGVSRDRLIGSAAEALRAAVTAIVAAEARCSPAEVMLTVLGTPPSGFVVPWSDASIGGAALERALTQVQLVRIEARTARLWPPGPFALGLAAARVVDAIIGSSRRAYPVQTVLGGEFGVRGRLGTVPALLSSTGIVQTRIPILNTRERVRLETALGSGVITEP